MGFGLPGGRFTIGPTSMQANADAGLPFADVPGDLAGQVEAVLEHEPNHPDPVIDFSHSRWDRRPFGLRTFLRPHVGGLAIAIMLVIVETSLLHLGPLLVQLGIDRGVLAKDTDVLVTLALVFVGSVVLAALATALRTAFTGRIGERLVYELRVRVFSHFQRQSLGFFTAERSGVLMTRMTSDIAALTVLFQEGLLQFVRLITAFNRRRHNTVRHHNIVGAHLDANLTTSRAQALYGPGTEAFGIISQAVILLVGGRMVLRNELSLGEMVAFLLFLTSFFAPIQTLVQLFNQYQQGSAAITKLRGVLATEPTVPEQTHAHDLPPVEGHLVLDSVTFGYDPDHLVLREVDLEVAPGEVLAVVGPTGAGKSTVAKLVTRFYDPDFGHVRLDGHDLRDVTLESLRRQVGVVPQEPFLFNGSIRQNVAFARPDAGEDEVWAACTAVGLDRLLDRLPAGIDSPVHERGASLSAGERQLLALARVFLAKPRMLVLDEATSNLDLLSEAVIERALDTVLEGRTAVIIAHRLATVLRADRIAVVDGGRIAEIGSHAELVALGGQYAAMHRTWVAQTTAETPS